MTTLKLHTLCIYFSIYRIYYFRVKHFNKEIKFALSIPILPIASIFRLYYRIETQIYCIEKHHNPSMSKYFQESLFCLCNLIKIYPVYWIIMERFYRKIAFIEKEMSCKIEYRKPNSIEVENHHTWIKI